MREMGRLVRLRDFHRAAFMGCNVTERLVDWRPTALAGIAVIRTFILT